MSDEEPIQNVQTPRGMKDILPEEQDYFYRLENVCRKMAREYWFDKIDTPIVEKADIFERTSPYSEVVQKQMYSFKSKGNRELVLRPEGTAAIARAYIEHGMKAWPKPVKLWYMGPFFRYEKPQAGRYRQHYQYGFEILGQEAPVLDAQIILLFYNLLQELHLENVAVKINSIGLPQIRKKYEQELVDYIKQEGIELCPNCRRRLKSNPLRILDCKQPECQKVKEGGPQIIDYLSSDSKKHFEQLLGFLDYLEIPYYLSPYLVRGLDYYTRTVFEFVIKNEEDEESDRSLLGGGRYDNLMQVLGGEPTPAVGGAGGAERVIKAMRDQGVRISYNQKAEVFLASLGQLAQKRALKLYERFRHKNVRVAEVAGKGSLKAQLKRADQLGVKYTIIIGRKEALENKVTLRTMSTGRQKMVNQSRILSVVKNRL